MDVEQIGRGLISGICLEKEKEREREREGGEGDYENQNYIFKISRKNERHQRDVGHIEGRKQKREKIALILKKFSLYFQENVSKKATQ
jgi:hypothetical protein